MQIWLTRWVSQSVQRSPNFCLKPYLISCYRRAESPPVRIKGQTISGWWLSHGIILSYLKLIRSDAPGIMRIHKITRRPRVTGIWSSKSHYVDLRPSASLIRSQWHSSTCLPTVNLFWRRRWWLSNRHFKVIITYFTNKQLFLNGDHY